MPDVDRLIEEIIRQKPDINEKNIRKLIGEKKKNVGSGYLTNSGAAFLVASDLNINLEVITKSELHLKDVYIGINEITVLGRIFTISPIKTYNKKDGTSGKYRRFTIFDKDTFIVVTLWDDQTNLIEERSLMQNNLVRVKKGYVKSSLDGRPIIHLSKNGDLEKVDDNEDKILFIEDLIKDILSVNTSQTNLALTGIVKSPPKVLEFTKKDGKSGKVLQIYLTNAAGRRNVRVSIWNNDYLSKIYIPQNAIVKLIGLKSRFSEDKSIEIHGDESTSIEVLSAQKSFRESDSSRFRILSIGKLRVKDNSDTSASLLVVDESNRYYTLILKNEVTEALLDIKTEVIIDCKFKEISNSTLLCSSRNSLKILNIDDTSFPKLHNITYKIKDIINSQSPLMLDAIALSRTSSQEITTKNGEIVAKQDVIVGDETGEIKIVAWRDLSDILSDITPGQRLRLIGVIPSKGLGGAPEIQVKSYSQIEKMS